MMLAKSGCMAWGFKLERHARVEFFLPPSDVRAVMEAPLERSRFEKWHACLTQFRSSCLNPYIHI